MNMGIKAAAVFLLFLCLDHGAQAINFMTTLSSSSGADDSVIVDRGDVVELRCSVSNSPSHNISAQILDHSGTVVASQMITAGSGVVTFGHNVTVHNSSFAGVYTCNATEITTPFTTMSDTFTINLNPYFSIEETGFQVDQEFSRLFLTATNGTSLTITCMLDSFPASFLVILEKEEGQEIGSSPTNTLEMVLDPITSENQGNYSCITPINPSVRLDFTIFISPEDLLYIDAEDNVTVRVGDTLTLTCNTSSGPYTHLEWIRNGEEIQDDCANNLSAITYEALKDRIVKHSYGYNNSLTIKLYNINGRRGGEYSCLAINNAGCEIVSTTIFVLPSVTRDLEDKFAAENDTVYFICRVEAFPPPEYVWEVRQPGGDFEEIIDVDGKRLVLENVTFDDMGEYRCTGVVPLLNASDTSNIATVYLSPEGTIEIDQDEIIAQHGQDVEFRCTAMGSEGYHIWMPRASTTVCLECAGRNEVLELITDIRNGLELEIFEDLNSTLQLANVNATYGGIYDCVIVNLAGFDVATSILYVEPHFVEHPEDVLTDQGESFALTCQAESFPDSAVYHWEMYDDALGEFVELGVNGSELAFCEIEYEEFGEYHCVAVVPEINRRTESFPALITVSPKGSLVIQPENMTAAAEESVNITCSALGGPNNTFTWFFNESEIVQGNDFEIIYDKFNSSVIITSVLARNHGGQYRCSVSNAAGSADIETTLYVSPRIIQQPVANILAENGTIRSLVCEGESFPYPEYEWTKIDGEDGTSEVVGRESVLAFEPVIFGDQGVYVCNVTSDESSVTSSEVTLHVSPVNSVSIFPETINSISGTTENFTCSALGGLNNSFEWIQVQTGAVVSMDEELSLVASASEGGMYRCRVSNLAGEETEFATLNVNPLILVGPEAVNVTAHTDDLILTCLVLGHPAPMISWLHNGTVISETDNTTITAILSSGDDFGQAMSTLSVVEPQISDSGLYQCMASNLDVYDDAPSEEVLVLVQDIAHAPGGVVATDVMSRSVTLEWEEPFDSNAAILAYYVFYSNPEFVMQEIDMVLEEIGNVTVVTDLHPYVQYNFTIVAANEEGNSSESDTFTVRTLEEAPGGPPQSVRVVVSSHVSIAVSWSPPILFDHHGIIMSYDIFYQSNDTDGILVEGVTGTMATLTELEEFVQYNVSVRARTSVGPGPYSEPILVTTDEHIPGPPPPPPAVADLQTTPSTATIVWSPPNDPNGIITGYEVVWTALSFQVSQFDKKRQTAANLLQCLDYLNIGATMSKNVSSANTTCTLTGLVPFTMYEFQVRAMTIVGYGNFSQLQSFTTDMDAPGAVANLQAVVLGSDSVQLSWDYPICPHGIINSYHVYYMNGTNAQTPPISSLGYTLVMIPVQTFSVVHIIRGLAPGESYKFHVQAVSTSGLLGVIDREVVVTLSTAIVLNATEQQSTAQSLSSTITSFTFSLPSAAAFAAIGITNISYYGVIVVPNPEKNFDITTDNFDTVYPDIQSYAQRGMNRYYIAAGWNNVDDIPSTFTVGDESTTTADRNGTIETYFNPALQRETPHCVYVIVHSPSETSNELLVRHTELFCRDTRLGYNQEGLIASMVILFFLLLLLYLVLLCCCCCFLRHQRNKKKYLVAETALELPIYKSQDTIIQNVYVDRASIKYPIKISNFPSYVRAMHSNNDYLFSEEYKHLEPHHVPTCQAAIQNNDKNRYHFFKAYDHSRVVLQNASSESDYINANFISGYQDTSSFIATQGPLPSTVEDFWQMVWEQKSRVIVLLTMLEENSRLKCHQYWPESPFKGESVLQFGSLSVQLVEEVAYSFRIVRTMTLTMEGEAESRSVKQYHYLWPANHEMPRASLHLLEFIQDIRKCYQLKEDGPMIVNCSSGVGRTGVFIAIYVQLTRMEAENTVDIFNFVQGMRFQRTSMVHNEVGYIFIHDALVEAINEGMVTGAVHVSAGGDKKLSDLDLSDAEASVAVQGDLKDGAENEEAEDSL